VRPETARHRLPLVLLFCLAVQACGAAFSQRAYDQVSSLKTDSLSLLDQATAPYDDHKVDVDGLKARLEEACAYSRQRHKNEVATHQWELMKDDTHHLLGGVLKRWQRDKTLSRPYIDEVKGQVSASFDQIIQLEDGRR
jgi:hypothetical protein